MRIVRIALSLCLLAQLVWEWKSVALWFHTMSPCLKLLGRLYAISYLGISAASQTGVITNRSPFCWNVSFISSKMLVEARRPCHSAGSPNVLGQLCCFWYPACYTIQVPFPQRFYPEEGPQCKLNKNQQFPSEKNKPTNKQKPTKKPWNPDQEITSVVCQFQKVLFHRVVYITFCLLMGT